MKIRLVKNWRSAWRWWSVHCNAVGAASIATWATIPADMRTQVPEWVLATGAGALFLLGLCARMVDQSKPTEAKNDE